LALSKMSAILNSTPSKWFIREVMRYTGGLRSEEVRDDPACG
jgi:hypothetical protein